MRVLKFGGTSVAGATAISKTLDIVCSAARQDRVILVCSAISGCTDSLIAIGKLQGDQKAKAVEALKDKHYAITNRLFTGAERQDVNLLVDRIAEELLLAEGDECQTYGELFSTNIIAKKLCCEGINAFWLDSRDLIRTKDGQVSVEDSYKRISDAIEAHPQVKVFVAPGFIARDEKGALTTLGRGGSDYSAALFAAAVKADCLQIWTDVPGIMTSNPKDIKKAHTVPQMSYKAAFSLAAHGAKVLYPPTVKPAMEVGLPFDIMNTFAPDGAKTTVSSQSCNDWVGVTVKDGVISLVADFQIKDRSVCTRIKDLLAKEGMTPKSITIEDDCVNIEIDPAFCNACMKALHRDFFERGASASLNIYIAGEGHVGKALVELIAKNRDRIARKTGKTMQIEGISRHECEDAAFFKNILENAPRHSIFVDCTDSVSIYRWYSPLLEAGIDIVSANRRSLSVPYAIYAQMKESALMGGTFLRYETTVATSLPILDSLARCANSSDEILSIEAVVSCSLNKILTSGEPFDQAMRSAQEAGLMEKDPSADLSGRDVLRKLLILAREAGVALSEDDVEVVPVRGDEDFTPGSRYVASLIRDERKHLGYSARIALQNVSENHPAWSIRGSENIIVIRSEFHPSPLVIRGAGEGATQAASSILNDILR